MNKGGRLNIALLLESDGPGGAEWMLLHLATELRRRGHAVLPVGPSNGTGWLAAEFRSRGFEPAAFSLNRPIDPSCVRGLTRLIRNHAIDVVHSHEFTMAVYGAAAAMVARKPHVITMHGGARYADRLRRRVAMRWSCRRSRHIVAVSTATRDRLSEALGIPAGKIDVIWNGVPYGAAHSRGHAVRQELAVAEDEVLALAVGNLYAVKGHAFLVEAFASIRRDYPDLPLRIVVAGRGQERDHLEGLIDEHSIGDRFHLLGFRTDVSALLEGADIFVMPSLSEGLPLALAEAMLAGKPIVASQVGGIPEIVQNGANGILVPAGDASRLAIALRQLAEDDALRAEFGRKARASAEASLTVGRMTDRYLDLYRSATGMRSAA